MNNKPTIGLIGVFQNGKSTLVNCLFGRQLAKVGGQGMSVTKVNTRYTFGTTNEVDFIHNGRVFKKIILEDYLSDSVDIPMNVTEIVIHYHDNLLDKFDIVDTPGFNANESESAMAESALKNIDMAILVLRNKSVSQYEFEITKLLSNYSIPFFIIVNTYDEGDDLWNPKSLKNRDILQCILNDFSTIGMEPIFFGKRDKIIVVNLIWYWLSLVPVNENKSIQLSQKKLQFFWEDYFGEEVTPRSLFFKSNFNDLFSKITSDEFSRCAIISKAKKEQSIELASIVEDFARKWEDVTIDVYHALQKQYYNFYDSKRKDSILKIESTNKQISELKEQIKNQNNGADSFFSFMVKSFINFLRLKEYKLAESYAILEKEKKNLSKIEAQSEEISKYLTSIFNL